MKNFTLFPKELERKGGALLQPIKFLDTQTAVVSRRGRPDG